MSTCSLKFKAFALAVISSVVLVTPGFAAIDMFLKIPGITGSSRLEAGALDVEQTDFNAQALYTPRDAASGLATGKRQHKPMTTTIGFTRPFDIASPELLKACAKGQHIKQAVLTCRKSGGSSGGGTDYLVITLKDCIVSSYSTSTNTDDDVPTESFALTFTSITAAFTVLDQNQQPSTIEVSWDMVPGKK